MIDTTNTEAGAWSKFLLFSGVLAIIVLVGGPVGYKLGLTALIPSLISILVAVVGAVLVLIAGLWMLVVAIRNDKTRDRNLVAIALVLSLIPMIFVLPQILKARSVPPIHDISTDTVSPPEFFEVVALRSKAPNDLIYAHDGSAETEAKLQAAAYPNVKPLFTELSVPDATRRAEAVLKQLGLEIINIDANAGVVEATATTYWFGFKDDLVVRVRPEADATRVDVRSVSRVGQSDVGANAARIIKFLKAY